MPLCAQLGNTDIYYQTKCRYGLKRAQVVNAANLETFPNIHINGSTGVKPVKIVHFNAIRVSLQVLHRQKIWGGVALIFPDCSMSSPSI